MQPSLAEPSHGPSSCAEPGLERGAQSPGCHQLCLPFVAGAGRLLGPCCDLHLGIEASQHWETIPTSQHQHHISIGAVRQNLVHQLLNFSWLCNNFVIFFHDQDWILHR